MIKDIQNILNNLIVLSAVILLSSCVNSDTTHSLQSVTTKTMGNIVRLDPRINAIIANNAMIEVIAEGHQWTEGPVWLPEQQALLYSDVPTNEIYIWREGKQSRVWLTPSGYTGSQPRGGELGSNGLVINSDGQLLIAQHGDRRIARLTASLDTPEAKFDTLIDNFKGLRFNSPNDLTFRHNGDLYFTDPPYGLSDGLNDPMKELLMQGVYRLSAAGKISLVTDQLSGPNGIAFSPEQDILYVTNSDDKQPVVMSYKVSPEGDISDPKIFFNTGGDGIAVDQQGNIYLTGNKEGVKVINSQGELLGLINTSQRTSNCTFGDNGSTLYITSDDYVVRIQLKVKGSK